MNVTAFVLWGPCSDDECLWGPMSVYGCSDPLGAELIPVHCTVRNSASMDRFHDSIATWVFCNLQFCHFARRNSFMK